MKLDNMTDREILIALTNDMIWVKKILSNHLRHHWALTLSLTGITVGTIVSLVIALAK